MGQYPEPFSLQNIDPYRPTYHVETLLQIKSFVTLKSKKDTRDQSETQHMLYNSLLYRNYTHVAKSSTHHVFHQAFLAEAGHSIHESHPVADTVQYVQLKWQL